MHVGPGLVVVVRRTPFQTKFQPAWFCALVVLNYSYYLVLGLNWPRPRKFVCILGLARVVILTPGPGRGRYHLR